jgi:hypothetical protein
MWRWRKFGTPEHRALYSDATAGLIPRSLQELREQAVAELVAGALNGADPPHMTKVAGLVVACDRRLTRRSVSADAGSH